ncbi:hypothetical protein [Acaryochloris sp. CCMEE 5410]|uniref:hypothetical protein n=1 Tax=Acaryochloris sp. CCMEE 5410 TaxID=310037 RepID=UPI0002484A42|nr:hypothetical protein [Acaryochloris sp. CCMEE 5410]KAI9131696.1 hypothetical protein ON05_029405 [Acaryochloris sp. CCMEE 5410]
MATLQYLNPQSTQTLRQGIYEFHQAEVIENDASDTVTLELLADIDMHDAIHVLFGCPTHLDGEILAHVWTALGTTVSLQVMHRVNRHQDHRSVLAEIGHRHLLKTWLKSIPQILLTMLRALRMKRRWPAEDYAAYLDQRLCDLRHEFKIHIPPQSSHGGRGGAALRTVHSS